MATFTWDNRLTVSVGEMSRAQALDACRQFDLAARVFPLDAELFREVDVIAVINAPVIVRYQDGRTDTLLSTNGRHEIVTADGQTITIELPLTHDNFNALPITLTEAWIAAASQSNLWFLDTLKKTLDLMTAAKPAPKSDSALSSGPSETAPLTTTIGA